MPVGIMFIINNIKKCIEKNNLVEIENIYNKKWNQNRKAIIIVQVPEGRIELEEKGRKGERW